MTVITMAFTPEDKHVSNEKKVEALFNDYAPGLIVYASRLTNEYHVAEDIVHDVFINIWNKRGDVEKAGAKSYLFSAVRNECLNHLAHRNIIRKYRERVSGKTSLPGTLTWDYYVEAELRSHIAAALGKLSPRQRKIFIMNRFDRKTYNQIAEELSISPRTVQKHIEMAVKSLRRDLSEYLPLLMIILTLCELQVGNKFSSEYSGDFREYVNGQSVRRTEIKRSLNI